MPIKDIDQIIHGGLPLRRVKTLAKPKPTSQPNPQHTLMKDVVPPLSRGDFLNCWKEDRRELEKIRTEKEKIVQENKKLRAVMNTTYSKDWPQQVSKILKEGKDDKTKT